LDRDRTATEFFYFFGDLSQFVVISHNIAQRDIRSGRGEGEGNRSTYPTACAGDKCNLTFETSILH
jgi:hypothetical protein